MIQFVLILQLVLVFPSLSYSEEVCFSRAQTFLSQINQTVKTAKQHNFLDNLAIFLQEKHRNPISEFLICKKLCIDAVPIFPGTRLGQLATEDDLKKSAKVLQDLVEFYKLNIEDVAAGKILENKYNNFSGDDCLEMVRILNASERNKEAKDWLREARTRYNRGDTSVSEEDIVTYEAHYDYEDKFDSLKAKFVAICRGEVKIGPSQHMCYISYRSQLIPIHIEILSRAPSVRLYHDVLSKPAIKDIIKWGKENQLLDAKVRYPNSSYGLVDIRVALTQVLEDSDLPVHLHNYMTNLVTGVTDLSTDHALDPLPMVLVKYEVGGKFDVHYDGFSPYGGEDEEYLHLAESMFYLNTVKHGGEFVMPGVPLKVAPTPGSLLIWYDYDARGQPDFGTLHGGCPVLLGEKWTANRPIRWYGQMKTCPSTVN